MPNFLDPKRAIRTLEKYAFDILASCHTNSAYLLKKNHRNISLRGCLLNSFIRENVFESFDKKFDQAIMDTVDRALVRVDSRAPSFKNGVLVTANTRYWRNHPYGLSIVFPLKNFRIAYNKFDSTILNQNKVLQTMGEGDLHKRISLGKGEDEETANKKAEEVVLDLVADMFVLGKKETLNKFFQKKMVKLEALVTGNFILMIPIRYLHTEEGREMRVWLEDNVAPLPNLKN